MSTSVTAKQLLRLRCDLTDRDWQIIAMLARVRVATSAQLEALYFSDVSRRRAQQRLAVLTRRRVLARLPRVIGGVRAGSRGHVYALDAAGQRLADLGQRSRPRRPRPVGTAYLDHALAVAEVYVRVVLAERSGALRLLCFAGEPGAWRRFSGAGGARVTLAPDAYLVTSVDGFEDQLALGREAVTSRSELGLPRRPCHGHKSRPSRAADPVRRRQHRRWPERAAGTAYQPRPCIARPA